MSKEKKERIWPPDIKEWDPEWPTPFEQALTGDLQCESCDYGPCTMKANEKAEKALGMPVVCPYGVDTYADFTAIYNIIKGKEAPHGKM